MTLYSDYINGLLGTDTEVGELQRCLAYYGVTPLLNLYKFTTAEDGQQRRDRILVIVHTQGISSKAQQGSARYDFALDLRWPEGEVRIDRQDGRGSVVVTPSEVINALYYMMQEVYRGALATNVTVRLKSLDPHSGRLTYTLSWTAELEWDDRYAPLQVQSEPATSFKAIVYYDSQKLAEYTYPPESP